MSVVIKVENLSKYYRLGVIGGGTLREDLGRWWAMRRGNPDPLLKIGEEDHGNRKDGQIWALRDVSFEVQEGELLGIIGRNGAGKSTLLKILSRITAPTAGRVKIKGRVASLLEVGTGFHSELTGRENIYLNGTILGMSRREVSSKLEEIIEFSETSKFIDTPVKRYSSGMVVRLAFAVAAHLEPEILIIDEVLAVGDAKFQKKCLGKMKDVSGEGRTVLFVSHNMQSISTLTSRCIVLNNGRIEYSGTSSDAIGKYLEQSQSSEQSYSASSRPHSPTITRIQVRTSEPSQVHKFGKKLMIEFDVQVPRCIKNASLSFQIVDVHSVPITHIWIFDSQYQWGQSEGLYRLTCEIEEPLLYMGRYALNVYLSQAEGGEKYETLQSVCPFEIVMHGITRDFKWHPDACRYLEKAKWKIELAESIQVEENPVVEGV